MMWRAVESVVLSSTVALMLAAMPGTAAAQNASQNASQKANGSAASSAGSAQSAAPAGPPAAAGASPSIGSSTSLNSTSNDLASLYGTPVEQIVARVNDRVITNSDLKRAQTQLAEESRQNNWTLEQFDQHKKDLLRDLIDQQLLLSKGKQLEITGDDELVRRLDQIRKQNHLASMDDLEKAVEQQGISYEDFKQNIRNSIITQQVVQQQVGSKMQISQADMSQYYRAHLDQFTHPESIELSEILIPTADDATSEQLAAADAKAKEVYAKLKAGGDFAALAKQYSQGPAADQGGDLGDFKRGSLAKVLEDQTFDLPPGGYTAPIRTRQGYIILKVTAHHAGGTAPMSKVEPQIEQAIYMQRIQPAVRKYLTQLRTEAYIDIRPGYVDAGASPDETKPTYTAYVPPQPKKKKERKPKERFERARMSDQARMPSAPGQKEQALESANGKPRTIKREKLRYGRPPLNPISAQQVPVASNTSSSTSAASAASATETAETTPAAAPGAYVQPLGPDLEHQPKIHPTRERKWRYSSLAREQSAKKKKEKEQKEQARRREVKAPPKNPAQPTPLTPAETANQKVQDAPLGLAGDTAHPKKKKKVNVNNGEKTRFSDRDKDNNENNNGSGSGTPPPSR